MLHPDTEIRRVSRTVGYGVFATAAIPKGTITWALDPLDQILTPQRVATLGPKFTKLIEKYAYINRNGNHVLCWDLARFMNHSCDANTMGPGFEFEIATRDIEKGEELTSDYRSFNLERSFNCACGCKSCRRLVDPEDFAGLVPDWDAQVRDAFPEIARVKQPLWRLVREKGAVRMALGDPGRIPSVGAHHWFAGVHPAILVSG